MGKAFEGWIRENKNSQHRESYDSITGEYLARQVWRAALKMVLAKMNKNKFMDNGELRTFIEQELENR